MFNNNEAIEPKQREKTVDDNTGTITMSVEQLCASVMKAHTPVMYAGSEQNSNGEGWARL